MLALRSLPLMLLQPCSENVAVYSAGPDSYPDLVASLVTCKMAGGEKVLCVVPGSDSLHELLQQLDEWLIADLDAALLVAPATQCKAVDNSDTAWSHDH
jgi:hypothetical protein